MKTLIPHNSPAVFQSRDAAPSVANLVEVVTASSLEALLSVTLDANPELAQEYGDVFYPSADKKVREANPNDGDPKRKKQRKLVLTRREHYYQLAKYLTSVSGTLNAFTAQCRYLVREAQSFSVMPDKSYRAALISRNERELKASITPDTINLGVKALLGSMGSGKAHIIKPSTKFKDGYDVIYSGLPTYAGSKGTAASLRTPLMEGFSVQESTGSYQHKDMSSEGGAYNLDIGKAALSAANAMLTGLFKDSQIADLASIHERKMVILPLDFNFGALLGTAINSKALTDLDIKMGDAQVETLDGDVVRGLGKYFSLVVIREASHAAVRRKIVEPGAEMTSVSQEFQMLDPSIGLSLVMHLPAELCSFITQTPKGGQIPLTALNTWASMWGSALLRVPNQRAKKVKGGPVVKRATVKGIPRYVIPASGTAVLIERRKALGFYSEEGRTNEDDLFVSNKGTFNFCPKAKDLALDNAKKYESIMEQALQLSFDAGTPLNASQQGETNPVFGLASPAYKEKISALKQKVKKFGGALQTFSWDYNCILTSAKSDPDKLVSLDLSGTTHPDELSIADYLSKPFAKSMQLLFIDSSIGEKRVTPEAFGQGGSIQPMVNTSVFANTFKLYEYLFSEKAVPTFADLLELSAKDMGLKSIKDEEFFPYEKGLYAGTISDSLEIADSFKPEASPLSQVYGIQRMLNMALRDSSGYPGSNLARAAAKEGTNIEEDPHFFNPEHFTLAEFKNVYSYLGGRIFYNMLTAIRKVDRKILMTVNTESTVDIPNFQSIVNEVMPLVIVLSKYVPDSESIYVKAEALAAGNRKDDSIGVDDIKVPGSKAATDTHPGFQMFPHQVGAHQYLRNRPRFAVLDVAPGGGKTILLLSDVASLVRDKHIRLPLIIAPNGLVRNWVEDMHLVTEGKWNIIPITTANYRFWGDEKLTAMIAKAPRNTIVVVGSSVLKLRPYPIVIGNHVEKVSGTLEFVKKFGFDYVALDESHRAKNPRTSLHKAIKQLTTSSSVKYIRLATGTLISNKLTDVVGQAALFNSQIFRTPEEYEEENSETIGDTRVTRWRKDTPKRARAQLARHVAVITTKRKEWAFMLPVPVEHFISVHMTKEGSEGGTAHQLMYDAILKETLAEIKKDTEVMDLLAGKDSDADEDDDGDDSSAEEAIGANEDLDDATLVDLESKLEPYLARLEQLLTDPLGDPFGEKFFGAMKDGNNFVSNKVLKIIERIKLSFKDITWEKGGTYKLKSVVDIDGQRYVLMPPSDVAITDRANYYADYKSVKDPTTDPRWKKEPRGKVIVFCRYKRSVDAIYRALPPELKKIAVTFHGGIKDKLAGLDAFKANPLDRSKGAQILIANEQSISEGHNLQCFPGQTQVMIDYKQSMSIADIYANPEITHVLSYNLESRKIERRQITGKLRHDVKAKDRYLNLRVTDNRSGEASPLLLTEEHPVFLKDGSEVEARDLKVGDQLITYGGSFSPYHSCPETNALISRKDWNSYRSANIPCPECGKVMHKVAHAKHLYTEHRLGKKAYMARRAVRSAATLANFARPGFLEEHSARMTEIGNRPGEGEARSARGYASWEGNDERRANASKATKKAWKKAGHKETRSAAISEGLKEFFASSDGVAHLTERWERYYEDVEAQVRKSEASSISLSRVSVRRKLSKATKAHFSILGNREAHSERLRNVLNTDEAREVKRSATAWCHANIPGYTEAGVSAMLKAQGTLPNKPESAVISLGVQGLEYTGDGDYWVTLDFRGKTVNKNPDFISLNHLNANGRTHKVLEVIGAREYTGRDAQYDKDLIRAYRKVGIECVVIDASWCYEEQDLVQVKSRLESFINNHYLTVTRISEGKSEKKIGDYKYDLNVEHNHNFFACAGSSDRHDTLIPVLVHNCADRLIRVESPWAPGELDQAASRIFRPDPSGRFSRENIYLDWIITNGSLEVAKMGRLISKMLIKAQFDEADNQLYDNINEAQLPLIRMSLAVIESVPLISDINEYIEAYQDLIAIQSAEFKDMRATRPSKMFDIEPDAMFEDAKILEYTPYLPNLRIPDRHNFGLVKLNDYLQDTSNPEVVEVQKDRNKLVGMYAHTEIGNGTIVRVNQSRQSKDSPESMRKISRVDVKIAGSDEIYEGDVSMIYLATNLDSKTIKDFALATPWATKGDKAKADRLRAQAERKAQTEANRMQRLKLKEQLQLEKLRKIEKLKSKAKPPKAKPQDDEDLVDAVPAAEENNNIDIYPVVYNGFLALEAVTEDEDIDLKAYKFRRFGDYAYVNVKDYATFTAVLAVLDKKFSLSSLTKKRLDVLHSSFASGRGRKFAVEQTNPTELKNFYRINHLVSKLDKTSNKPELKVYPVILNGALLLNIDIATNPAVRRLLTSTIAVGAKTVKFVKASGIDIKFVDNKKLMEEEVKALQKEGFVITNLEEFKKELTELSLKKSIN